MTSTNSKAVVLATARTPFGKLGGAIAPLSATTLGAVALAGAIQRAGIDPSEIEHLIFGEVLQAGVGQNPARQVVFKSGLAKTVTAETVNKVCASGIARRRERDAVDQRRCERGRRGRRNGIDVQRSLPSPRARASAIASATVRSSMR